MKLNTLFITLLFTAIFSVNAQEEITYTVFKKEPINFNGTPGKDIEVERLQSGRIIYKKVSVPKFKKGTDVSIKLTVRSNGDRWDKSGSCFVVNNLDELSIIDISKGNKEFPIASTIDTKFKGVKATDTYKPVVELLRFMTPFGVGYYSDNTVKYRRPVYIPSWEKEVVWEQDISQLKSLVTNTFYVGVWIDSWTAEGYEVDLELNYSNRSRKTQKVITLVNTVPYVSGQSLPDFFARTVLEQTFELPKKAKNVKLYYTTTGHGGHSGGDEFIKIKNSVFVDNKLILDTIPWRDDCASFRRFNPTSGVWIKKDSASYIDSKTRSYQVKEIEERIASSDLSRSNWCPGSSVKPFKIDLSYLKSGKHTVKISIPATAADGDKLNHWLVSAYVTYEE
ncbi:N-glycanase [Lutibacter sp. A64]|uniref:PNGase F N-terminal domain-containing protein n=1 Tax=Lutibacter sp. A64 TaxID=2918526 RepID=UPI001F070DE7|nr:PNGase F N-terminal domain-containing protein [Lutibacter sp. A64]UMB55270.1 N-glycanase [Lutibacter sp. A64]